MSDEKKSARKWWWIIMLLPIGLAVGSVTSLVNHLNKNEEEEAQEQYKVAIALNAKAITNAMQKSLIFGKRDLTSDIGLTNTESVKRFIEGDVSPGGTGQQWEDAKVTTSNNRTIKLSYTDIVGTNEDDIVAIVIELVSTKNKADASKLGMSPSVIRSLIKEKTISTIRFVLTPMTGTAQEHAQQITKVSLNSGQELRHTIVLKEQDTVELEDRNEWKDLESGEPAVSLISSGKEALEISHPVLRREEIEIITPKHSAATLEAAAQLKDLIIKAAN